MPLAKKVTLVVISMSLLVFVYFFDNIKGQYRFMQYCKNEGGLHLYQRVNKNVGWEAKDYSSARSAFVMDYVGFVRYRSEEENNKLYDLYYKKNESDYGGSFEKYPSDEEKKVKYVWDIEVTYVVGESRLKKTTYMVSDKVSGETKVIFNRFVYSQFDRGIFSAPSYVYCFKKETPEELKKIFKDN